jgi:hypothetical protein
LPWFLTLKWASTRIQMAIFVHRSKTHEPSGLHCISDGAN